MTPAERRAEVAQIFGRALRRVLERDAGKAGPDAQKASDVATSPDGSER